MPRNDGAETECCSCEPRDTIDCWHTTRSQEEQAKEDSLERFQGEHDPTNAFVSDSSLQNSETVSFYFSKPFSLWYFVTSDLGN